VGITYEVDAAAGLIREHWAGAVTAEDLAAHWTTLLDDSRVMACLRDVADLRRCQIRFSGEDLRRLTLTLLEPGLRGHRLKVAVLVEHPLQFGVARQHQVFSEAILDVQVFTDADAARAWARS
jgi:hypothetical protein